MRVLIVTRLAPPNPSGDFKGGCGPLTIPANELNTQRPLQRFTMLNRMDGLALGR